MKLEMCCTCDHWHYISHPKRVKDGVGLCKKKTKKEVVTVYSYKCKDYKEM